MATVGTSCGVLRLSFEYLFMSVSNDQLIQSIGGLYEYCDSLLSQGMLAEAEIAATPAHARADWLEQTAAALFENRENLAATIVHEGIKTISEARSEVNRAHYTLKLCAEEARRIGGETVAFDQVPNGAGRSGWIEKHPVGLIAAITPFNDPLNLVVHKVGPAIAAGCPVILKPHQATPGPALKLAELFIDSGMPGNYFQVCDNTSAEAGEYLVQHSAIKMSTFTGGKATGIAIAKVAAGRPVALELGGVCATIVLADANLDIAPQRIVSGMFAAAGQNCLHVQRLLVDEVVYDSVVKEILALTARLKLGDPMNEQTDMGELISEAAAMRCDELVADAVESGGSIAAGGTRIGKAYQPTVLVDVSHTARIYHEEVFGPVTVIEKIRGIDDAVARLNQAEASLATAIFTQTLSSPFVLRKLRTGSIMVNDSTDFRIDAMPFGGPFPAGLGREGVKDAINSMTETQLICINFN